MSLNRKTEWIRGIKKEKGKRGGGGGEDSTGQGQGGVWKWALLVWGLREGAKNGGRGHKGSGKMSNILNSLEQLQTEKKRGGKTIEGNEKMGMGSYAQVFRWDKYAVRQIRGGGGGVTGGGENGGGGGAGRGGNLIT